MMVPPAQRGLPVTVLQLKTSVVDLTWLTVTRDGEVQPLTETEAALLRHLVSNVGRDVDRDELQAALGRSQTSARAIDIAVARLRAKLGEPKNPNHIRTVRGVGYRFVDAQQPTVTAAKVAVVRRPLRVATGRIDLDRREFTGADGQVRSLNKLDVDLLERLASGRVVDREQLVREVWGRGRHERSLSAALRRLRQRLDDDPEVPRVVISVPGGLRLARLDLDQSNRTNLRPERTPFVDRPEVAALLERLDQEALITVRGPAGIGKTRLVYEAGLRLMEQDPAREVWFCDLACALAEQGIVGAIDAAMGSDPEGLGDAGERIAGRLARKPPGTVIILDNFDQITHLGTTLEGYLRRAPHVRFVITSRHALGLSSERCLDVGPLTVEAAATLFVDRAKPIELDEGDASVQTLVARLDCLPLAVELAAARASEFTTDEMLSRLERRLDWLNRPPAGTSSPHRSLRGALDWSWDLLDDDTRQALAECSVFARTFDRELAAAVLSVPDPDRALAQLTERSLLDGSGLDRSGLDRSGLDSVSRRYRLYEGIRDYAREKLILSGRASAAASRWAEATMERAAGWVDRLRRAGLVSALSELRVLRDDLLAIASRTTTSIEQRARAVILLVPVLQVDGPRHLIRSLCAELLALELPPVYAWPLWTALAELDRLACHWGSAHRCLDQALAAAQAVGPHAVSPVHRERVFCWVDSGRIDEAEALLEELLAQVQGAQSAPVMDMLRYRAKIRAARGELPQAAREFEEVVRSVRRLGDPLRLYHLQRDLATVHLARGDLDRADSCALASIELAQELRLRRGEYDGRWGLAQIARQRGEFALAERLVSEAREGYLSLGEDQRARLMLRVRALVRVEAGKLEEAEQDLLQVTQEGGDELRAIDSANLAIVRHLKGELPSAVALFRELCAELAPGPFHDAVLAHLAAALAEQGEVEEAGALWGEIADPAPIRSVYEVLELLLLLARGRARSGEPEVLARVQLKLQQLEASGPGGAPSPALRDQDLNLARLLLVRSASR
jgi:DNA-binding response OmpR family regulator/predicted ATPase/tetratricopeptide (TPR) repeat protein